MPIAVRRSNVEWTGELPTGRGVLHAGTSGALDGLEVTLPSRVDRPDGRTSPEELLASAHAACFAMALTGTLEADGTPAQSVDVSAVCTLDRDGDAFAITTTDLHVSASGVDRAVLADAAQRAERSCPVSNALRAGVEIRLHVSSDAPART